MKIVFIIIATSIILVSCKKDTIITQCPEPPLPKPTVKFMFVNRNGFRSDSVGNGINDTLLSGVCIESRFYNPETNISNLWSACYNRNFPTNNYPLTDSILHETYPLNMGSKYAYEIEIVWKKTNLATTKLLRYASSSWPNGALIITKTDTIIKFIWPNDTMPGSGFYKTYQFP